VVDSHAAREWFAQNRYQDYLYLHGLSVELPRLSPNRP
jgi:5-methyltetrahydrofolate--homocysteine methyltransferase